MLDASALDEARIFDAIALFEDIGDPAGAARGWSALVVMNCGLSDRLQGGEAAERMLDCAKRAGSHALINQAMRDVAGTLALGAAPIPKAIPRARALFEDADDPYTRARILNCIASMEASRGRFDEARSLIGQARTLVGRADRRNLEGFLLSVGARLELHARNPHRAEELARGDCAELESQGMVRYLSSELCFLVDALIAQGRLEEAAVQLERAAPMAAPDDADALQRQARSRARLEFARGDLVAAEGAARESLAHVEQAMAPDEHAECLLVLANVLVAAGRDGEAHEAARQALAHSEERGHEVFVAQARDLLGTAQPVAAG
jgi:ATP/maltotriose-dependent transcriptional regulator MalT